MRAAGLEVRVCLGQGNYPNNGSLICNGDRPAVWAPQAVSLARSGARGSSFSLRKRAERQLSLGCLPACCFPVSSARAILMPPPSPYPFHRCFVERFFFLQHRVAKETRSANDEFSPSIYFRFSPQHSTPSVRSIYAPEGRLSLPRAFRRFASNPRLSPLFFG